MRPTSLLQLKLEPSTGYSCRYASAKSLPTLIGNTIDSYCGRLEIVHSPRVLLTFKQQHRNDVKIGPKDSFNAIIIPKDSPPLPESGE